MADIQSGAVARQGVRVRDITGYQWLVLFIAWAGWSLDITDFTLYGLVLRQSLTELLGGNPTLAQIGSVGGLITTIGLLGWAVGGFVFGIVADYIGRVRTLALSILIYSVFTALQGTAQEAWQLGLFRFIAGLGTGAEFFFFQAEDGIRDGRVTGVQTCALPISSARGRRAGATPGAATSSI